MEQRLKDCLTLPESTGECDIGPEILMRPGAIEVKYDVEGRNGPRWTTLRFEGALALRVAPDYAAGPIVTGAYSKVCVVENSLWIATLREHSQHEIPTSFKHFTVFFDHYICVETVAQSVGVVPAPDDVIPD
ncbi:MAG TPA: hypothetical protein VHU80_12975 [Polyangiaceae bacterium]|jgi:hypothetical protein|nr:hypothetical protein [Polyangiaceae bacterium]